MADAIDAIVEKAMADIQAEIDKNTPADAVALEAQKTALVAQRDALNAQISEIDQQLNPAMMAKAKVSLMGLQRAVMMSSGARLPPGFDPTNLPGGFGPRMIRGGG